MPAGEATAEPITVVRTPRPVVRSARVIDVALKFGLNPVPPPVTLVENLDLHTPPGTITLLSGPSGTGKTSLLQAISERDPRARFVHHVRFPAGRAVIDGVAPRNDVAAASAILTACALGEPRLWVQSFADLSDGEQFRARLARAVGQHLATKSSGPLMCDEFCAVVHRRAAKAIAHNIRKLVTREGLALVVATNHDDLAADLQPDQTVRLPQPTEVQTPPPSRRSRNSRRISFAKDLVIEPGGKQDYDVFSPMHYRQTEDLGFVDKIFVLKEKRSGDPLAIVVYAYGPLELSLRNKATGNRFRRNAKLLNEELRILRRLVVHPDIRGCGLGHELVSRTLGQVGVPFIECLAAMGTVNPVFEKAGMERIGLCPVPKTREKLLKQLAELDVHPQDPDFVSQVCRRPRVRRLVVAGIADWYRTVSTKSAESLQHKPAPTLANLFRQLAGSRPVYYLWRKADPS